ncbi:MAG: hypothetical protein QXV22_00185 [Thermoplasmataceae archaeon]
MMKTRYISIPEVKQLLSSKKDVNQYEGEALGYCEHFSKLDYEEAQKIKEELSAKMKLPEKVITKLIDICPASKEEATSILSVYNILLSEEDLNNLVSYFANE